MWCRQRNRNITMGGGECLIISRSKAYLHLLIDPDLRIPTKKPSSPSRTSTAFTSLPTPTSWSQSMRMGMKSVEYQPGALLADCPWKRPPCSALHKAALCPMHNHHLGKTWCTIPRQSRGCSTCRRDCHNCRRQMCRQGDGHKCLQSLVLKHSNPRHGYLRWAHRSAIQDLEGTLVVPARVRMRLSNHNDLYSTSA